MIRIFTMFIVAVLLSALSSSSMAGEQVEKTGQVYRNTSSGEREMMPASSKRTVSSNPSEQSDLLLLATTSVSGSVEQALTNLGQAYDLLSTEVFDTLDFSPYSTIMVAMDGGGVSESSVQALADAAAAGKLLFILGGTNWVPYYDGLQMYLLSHTGQTGWVTSAAPHLVVTNANHPLSAGLPSEYTFVNNSASFYMLRVNDPQVGVAANNGDGEFALFNKAVGMGQLIYFVNSPWDQYWTDPDDFGIMQQIISNGLGFQSATITTSPDSFAVSIPANTTKTEILTIGNVGQPDLNFNLTIAPVIEEGVRNSQDFSELQKFPSISDLRETGSQGENATSVTYREALNTEISDLLLVTTIDVSASVEQALTNLGQTYDLVNTTDFTSIDYTPYSTIMVAMDGGLVGDTSVQALADAASLGKKLFILGGTNWQPYYDGLQMYLLSHTGQTGWVTSASPHLQITDPTHGLSAGLPSTYDFVNPSASFYMVRVNDPMASVAAKNGDGEIALFNKPVGMGQLIYFVNSPESSYWSDANDLAILQQVISNGLGLPYVSWLTVDMSNGTISSGDSVDVNVNFNATGLAQGDYFANILISSNDFANTPVLIPAQLTVGPVVSIEDPNTNTIPVDFRLQQNFPNPFNPLTTIRYQVSRAAQVKIAVYNTLGEQVATLVNEPHRAGNYLVRFDASALASGLYFYTMQAGNFSQTRKMLLIR